MCAKEERTFEKLVGIELEILLLAQSNKNMLHLMYFLKKIKKNTNLNLRLRVYRVYQGFRHNHIVKVTI